MKKILKILILMLLPSINLIAQTELPYNINEVYIEDSKGYKIIKTTRTYASKDYHAETYHYFDNKGLNFKTVDFFNSKKQGFTELTFNKNDKLNGFKDYSQWISTYDSINSSYWDSTIVSWENQYKYDSLGRITFCTYLSYDQYQKPNYYQELKIEYNRNNQILKKIEYSYVLSDSINRIYFEPNSTKVASNQDFPTNSLKQNIYKYDSDTITIENYYQSILKSTQKIIKKDTIETEFLFDSKNNLLKTTTKTFNKNNNLIEEKCDGNCEISKYCEYGDGITYNRITYKYSSTGLLIKKVFTSSKYNVKIYVDYEYFK